MGAARSRGRRARRLRGGSLAVERPSSCAQPPAVAPRLARPPPHQHHHAPQRRPRSLPRTSWSLGVRGGVRGYGSIQESPDSAGVMQLLEKSAFKDMTPEPHVDRAGGGGHGGQRRRLRVQAVELLLSVRNPLFLQDEVDRQLALTREEVQEVQKIPEKFLQEVLNLVGYEWVIANLLIATEEALGIINADIIQKLNHSASYIQPSLSSPLHPSVLLSSSTALLRLLGAMEVLVE